MIPTQTLNGVEISTHRKNLLSALEQIIENERKDLSRRGVEKSNFRNYASFFSTAVFGLINWEQISRSDLEYLSNLKTYFCDALIAARNTRSTHFKRDAELQRGNERRSFADIASAELAVNVLPRLENILNGWGITVDLDTGQVTVRELSDEESIRLTRYYRSPS